MSSSLPIGNHYSKFVFVQDFETLDLKHLFINLKSFIAFFKTLISLLLYFFLFLHGDGVHWMPEYLYSYIHFTFYFPAFLENLLKSSNFLFISIPRWRPAE